jgi:hypothetical protein
LDFTECISSQEILQIDEVILTEQEQLEISRKELNEVKAVADEETIAD